MTPPRLLVLALISALALQIGSPLEAARADDQARAPSRPQVLEEVPATANNFGAPRSQNSALLAADPTAPRFVALANRLDAPDFGCALQVSGDGGRGWIPAKPFAKLPPGARTCYSPEIAFDSNGVLYYLFVGLAGRGNSPMGVFLTTSADRAQSFSKPRRLLGAGNYQVRMAIDPAMGDHGRIYLLWLKTGAPAPTGGLPSTPNPILTAYSDDGGKTFSRPVQVNDRARRLSVAADLAVGPDHAVHVLYYDLREDRRDYQGLEGPAWPGRWSVVSTTSSDGGRHFQPGVAVDDRVKPPGRVILIYTMPPPAVVAGRSGKMVFAAWTDARNGDWDVFLSRSTDGGRSWARPLRLNDDRAGNGRHQYLPRLSVAPNGRLDAIFLDRRDDPRNAANHTYYTYSTDGGRHFAPNIRLTSSRSDSRSGQRYFIPSARGLVDFGARVALLSRDAGALAAWTDTRNSFGTGGQDIFTGEVVLPPGGGASVRSGAAPAEDATSGLGPIALLGIAAVLLAGVGFAVIRRRGWVLRSGGK